MMTKLVSEITVAGGRNYGFLGMNGFDYLRGDEKQVSYASEWVKIMPVFPEDGSVINENGIIIVNLQ